MQSYALGQAAHRIGIERDDMQSDLRIFLGRLQ